MKRAIEALSYEKSENTVGWGFHPNVISKKGELFLIKFLKPWYKNRQVPPAPLQKPTRAEHKHSKGFHHKKTILEILHFSKTAGISGTPVNT